MKDEYDFSKGQRGKFFRKDAALRAPVHLDPHVREYLMAEAAAKGTSLDQLVNELLEKDIEQLKAAS